MTDEQLSALLRLKRYEQPPAEYFDQLLRDIHRRQRTDLLRRPLWKIAVERVQTWFSEHSMGHMPYAGAMAAILVAGTAVIGWLTSGGDTTQQEPRFVVEGTVATEKFLTLQSAPALRLDRESLSTAQHGFAPGVPQPRDARPVSYELSSFNF